MPGRFPPRSAGGTRSWPISKIHRDPARKRTHRLEAVEWSFDSLEPTLRPTGPRVCSAFGCYPVRSNDLAGIRDERKLGPPLQSERPKLGNGKRMVRTHGY